MNRSGNLVPGKALAAYSHEGYVKDYSCHRSRLVFFTTGQVLSGLALITMCALMQAHAAGPDEHPPASQQTVASAEMLLSVAGSKESGSPSVVLPRVPQDPAAVIRGKQVFSVNCGFCHGSDARGGEGGPNLLRSPIVRSDREGEVISAVVLSGRVEKGMPMFDLSMSTIADIAAYVHSIQLSRDAAAPLTPEAILVGNPAAGKAYFYGRGHCSQCHSLSGDFAGIGSRFAPKALQDNIISGAATTMLGAPLPTAPPQTVIVTLPSGEVTRGKLISEDDFNISLEQADGSRRTFPRDGNIPRVEVHNPLQAHLDMLRNWEDRDIHNLAAFLARQR